MKKIYEYNIDCGRHGSLDGMFVADEADIEKYKNTAAYFGEVLGKHSNVIDYDWASKLTVKTDDQDFIAKFVEIMGDGTISGTNPLEYARERCEEDQEAAAVAPDDDMEELSAEEAAQDVPADPPSRSHNSRVLETKSSSGRDWNF